MGCATFVALKFTKLYTKMFKLKDFEGRVCCAACGHDPPKRGEDTGAGRLAPVSQTVGSIFRTPHFLAREKGLSIAPISCITWSIFKVQKWQTLFRDP
jgi:hypothetical protein